MSAVSKDPKALIITAQALSAIPQAATGDVTGTKTCDAIGCTYDKYGSGGFVMTGSAKASDVTGGKKVVWNLTGTLNATGTQPTTSSTT